MGTLVLERRGRKKRIEWNKNEKEKKKEKDRKKERKEGRKERRKKVLMNLTELLYKSNYC